MEIFPKPLSALSQEEVCAAIRAHLALSTVEQLRSGPLSILPHQALSSLYYSLRATEKDIIVDAGLTLLESLMENPAEWTSDSADELLLFIDDIAAAMDHRDRLVEVLLSLSQRTSLGGFEGIDLRLRALGLLLGIGFRAAPEFWENIYETGGEAYAYSVFDGLGLIDPRLALQWSNQLPDEETKEVIYECLPGLIEDIGAGTFLKLAASILSKLKPAAAIAVSEAAKYEGIDLEWYALEYQAPVEALGTLPQEPPLTVQLEIQSQKFDEALITAYERDEIDAIRLYDLASEKRGTVVACRTAEEALARRIRNGEWPVGDAALLYSRNPVILNNPEYLSPPEAIRLQDEVFSYHQPEPLTAVFAGQ